MKILGQIAEISLKKRPLWWGAMRDGCIHKLFLLYVLVVLDVPIPGGGGGGGTIGRFGWGCTAGTLEPLAYTRASWSEFCYPILDLTPQIPLS